MTPETLLYGRWRESRDSEAFREIVERHLGMVYATARRILATKEDAEEVAQECFEQLAMSKTVVRENVAGWLYRSASHRALDRARSESARKARELRYADHLAQTEAPPWNEIYAYVDEAITALPDDLRSAIVLRYFEGHTHEAAAAALGVSPNTVMNRVKRGVEEIRRHMNEKGVVAGVSLTAVLAGLNSEAAPVALVASVNKIALAGWAGAGAATYVSSVVTGVFIMKNITVGVTVALAIVLAGLGIYAFRNTPPKTELAAQQKAKPAAVSVSTQTSASPPAAPPKTKAVVAPVPPPIADDEEEALKPNKARVEGVLLDTRGAPLPDYTIAGIRLGDRTEQPIARTRTREKGVFTLNNIAPGRYWITTTGSRNPRRQFAPPQKDNVVVALTAGETKTGVVVRYSDGLAITGHVVDEKGKPIDAAEIVAQGDGQINYNERYPILVEAGEHVQGELANMLNMTSVYTYAAKDGRFTLANLVEGKYQVSIAQTGYRQADLSIEAGATDVEVVLEKMKIAVSGQVVDAVTGKPLPKAELCLCRTWPGSSGAISNRVKFDRTADTDGRFTLTDENAMGIGFVVARAKGHLAEAVRLQTQNMSEDGRIGDVLVELRPSRKARGTVVNEKNAGMPKVNLYLGDPPNPNFSMVSEISIGVTDSAGAFEVTVPSGEPCVVSATTQELGKVSKKFYVGDSAAVPEGTADVDGIVLTLSENGASITGALSIDGAPAPRIRVVATANAPKIGMYYGFDGESDDTGQYNVNGLPAMAYRVEVLSHICPGFGPYVAPTGQRYTVTGISKVVTLERRQNVTADLDFVSGESEIVGRLYPLGVEPDKAIFLSLLIMRAGGTQQTYMLETESDGSFHAAGLPAGDAKWTATYVQGNKVYRWGGALQLGAMGSITLTPELTADNQTSTD